MDKVLVVDDEPLVCRELSEALKRAGYEVAEARNGRQAMRVAATFQPAAIITDIVMPETDGFELIRALTRDAPNTKIIAISSGGNLGFPSYLMHAKKFGAHAILEKPVDIAKLLVNVRLLLQPQEP